MSNLGRFWSSLVALSLIGLPAAMAADNYDKVAAEARARSSETVVKCSPEGEVAGTISMGEALRALKPGNILQLHPGKYASALAINVNEVIIEGVPGKYCEAKIEVYGKDCVIRNLWTNHLELIRGTVVIDSVVNFIVTPYDDVKNESLLYNSCCRAIYLCNAQNTMAIVGSTILQGASNCFALGSYEFCTYKVRDSIIYSQYIAIRVRGNLKLDLERSLVYGNTGLAKNENLNARKQGIVVRDLKSFKRLTKSRIDAACLFTGPAFRRPSTIGGPDRVIGCLDADDLGNGWFWTSGSEEAPDFFLLAENSSGLAQGLGANLDEKGFPVPRVVAAPSTSTPVKR